MDGESETKHSRELVQHVHQEAFIISKTKPILRSIVDRFLKSPLPFDEVGHGHDEGPVGDSCDLEGGASEPGLP